MDQEVLERRLHKLAQQMPYPPTPDIAGRERRRLESGDRKWTPSRALAGAALVIVLLAAVLFAVPGVRAEIVRFIQVGVVRIFTAEPTPTPETGGSVVPYTATPIFSGQPTAVYRASLLDLAGETSLDAAQQRANFLIRLPTYPLDLGPPQRVFYQQDGPLIVLVWLDPEQPEEVRMSLHEIGPGSVLLKKMPPAIQEVQVNGTYAAWTDGPYLLETNGGAYREFRLVEGHSLIWTEEDITYRLETDLSLEEAIRIAESLE